MKETETITMTRNHLARTVATQQNQQLQQQQHQTSPQQQFVHHQQTKWSIKERLFLVACVLINGESNWTFISDQLNKWMKYTSNYINITVSNNISILGANSYNLPPITLRTNNVSYFYAFFFLKKLSHILFFLNSNNKKKQYLL